MFGDTKAKKRQRAVHLMIYFGAATGVSFGVMLGAWVVGGLYSALVFGMVTIALVIITLGCAIYVIAEDAQEQDSLREVLSQKLDEEELDKLTFIEN